VTPPEAFDLLFDEELDEGAGLPPPLRRVYGGDWTIPAGAEPYVYVNFVVSRDGRVSFREPGHLGGGPVSAFDRRDRWLMGVLRARADAVLIGDGTLMAEPDHVWTAEGIYPEEAAAFRAVREAEGRSAHPLLVVLSLRTLPTGAAMLERNDLEVLVATPDAGEDAVDLRALTAKLAGRGVRTLLCEGGPRVYGALLRSGLGFDEFLTLSPLVLGESNEGPERPSLVEGTAFAPGEAPASRLLSVRRGGDYLYLRSRYPGG
jgi:riboflavin biosynthesis pyrimidine reductase